MGTSDEWLSDLEIIAMHCSEQTFINYVFYSFTPLKLSKLHISNNNSVFHPEGEALGYPPKNYSPQNLEKILYPK